MSSIPLGSKDLKGFEVWQQSEKVMRVVAVRLAVAGLISA